MNIKQLDAYEVKQLAFCINHFGDRGHPEANIAVLKHFDYFYARRCIVNALEANDLTTDYKLQLRMVREKLADD